MNTRFFEQDDAVRELCGEDGPGIFPHPSDPAICHCNYLAQCAFFQMKKYENESDKFEQSRAIARKYNT